MKAYKTSVVIEADSKEQAQSFLADMIKNDPDQAIEHFVHQFNVVGEHPSQIIDNPLQESIPSAIMGDRDFDYESNETGYDHEIKAWEEE